MTTNSGGEAQNGNAGHQNRQTAPPDAPPLTEQRVPDPFSTDTASTGIKREIKLTVEFPLREEEKYPNDLAYISNDLLQSYFSQTQL